MKRIREMLRRRTGCHGECEGRALASRETVDESVASVDESRKQINEQRAEEEKQQSKEKARWAEERARWAEERAIWAEWNATAQMVRVLELKNCLYKSFKRMSEQGFETDEQRAKWDATRDILVALEAETDRLMHDKYARQID